MIYRNLSYEKYDALPGWRSSNLNGVNHPKKLRYQIDNPPQTTRPQLFGQFVHALLFEKERVSDQFACLPDGLTKDKLQKVLNQETPEDKFCYLWATDQKATLKTLFIVVSDDTRRNSKEWKEIQADNHQATLLKKGEIEKLIILADQVKTCRLLNNNKSLEHQQFLTELEYKQGLLMRDEIKKSETFQKFCDSSTDYELSLTTVDKVTGLPLKARVDFYHHKMQIAGDYKTAKDITDKFVLYSPTMLNYETQAAMYMDILKQNSLYVDVFYFFLQEKEPPYLWRIIEYSGYELERITETYMEKKAKLARHVYNDDWPGYPDSPIKPQDLRSSYVS